MFSFNRNEQIAILLLCGALLVGGVVSLVDRYASDRIEDFDVVKGAIPVPSDSVSVTPETPTAPADSVPASPTIAARIDLNQASEKELQQLPGIGPHTAGLIVAYRTQHGAFRRLEDLTAVRGIGKRTVERLKPLVTLTNP